MIRRTRTAAMIAAMGLGVFLAAGAIFLVGRDRSAVDWRSLRAVAFESDDWGLAGFLPDAQALSGLDRDALAPGRFPDVYWGSTLEDSAQVGALTRVLAAAARGRDGLPPVWQPNYVMGSLSWEEGARGGRWIRYDWPEFSPRYVRPGLTEAVVLAMDKGLWYPEYHAFTHYDPLRRMESVASGGIAAEAARRGIMLFPGSEEARELGPWRSRAELEAELEAGLARFASAFGRPVGSIIAPDYTWDRRCESVWASRGVRVIQAKREQRYLGREWGTAARVRKLVDQRLDRILFPGRAYLERNCRFEPVQSPDPGAVALRCALEVKRAWAAGSPAVVESHRINFVHTDPQVIRVGLEALERLLAELDGPGDLAPIYLTDVEIAGLMRNGTSSCVRGPWLVLRNGTRSGRILAVEPGNHADSERQAGGVPPGSRFFLVPAGTVLLIPR
ncbi:MAG: hypothetical protein AB7V45_12150 [Candidatus Krumholzibacteriia bacterium]